MIVTSVVAFGLNRALSSLLYGKSDDIDFEKPLTNLVWITSILSIIVTFIVSKIQIGHLPNDLWLTLSAIISCGSTLGAALIPEIYEDFSLVPKSQHVATKQWLPQKEGGPSLKYPLQDFVAGNFSAFLEGDPLSSFSCFPLSTSHNIF
ncbi:hypothetical protein MASR1M107_33090 [Ignavibacteriales bacterium]